MTVRAGWVAACRAVAVVFLLATALYGIVAFSPFGYDLFVKPHAITWIVWCLTYYDALSLGVMSLTLIGLAADIERRSTRALASTAMGCGAVVVAYLFFHHVLDSLTSDARSLVVAGIALLAVLWLSLIDHLACWRSIFGGNVHGPTTGRPQLFGASAVTTVYVVALFAGLALMRPATPAGLATAVTSVLGRSLLLHALAFVGLAWLLAATTAVAAVSSRPRVVEYLAGLGLLAAAAFALMRVLVLNALDLNGPSGLFVAAAFAVGVAAGWSGIALRLASASRRQTASGLEVLSAPALPWRSTRAAVVWLALLIPLASFVVFSMADRFEWPRLLQIVGVLTVWIAAWCAMLVVTHDWRWPSNRLALLGSVALLILYPALLSLDAASDGGSRGRRLQIADEYAALDPSFNLIDDIGRGRALMATDLQHFARANSNIAEDIAIRPTSIDFSNALTAAPAPPPHIFLFVIDSLRPDYLSVYNPAVTFTPAIGALARESLVFRNAFTRYGGTGLAVPAIWAGGMLPHRSYVTPFGPMNALKKLLDANQYRLMASFDSIMVRLLPRTPDIVELGADSWTARDDVCRVLGDLNAARPRARANAEPVFAYSLPQNVHLTYVQGHPIQNEEYRGFYSLLAARVHQVDRCLGAFIDDLKADGSYDNSVIIVTSDHGDAIGEEGRWGHGFAGFPEVFRIPMIVHLPPRLAARWTADVDAVSFSTDLAPTLYRLLGQDVSLRGPIFGTPLVVPPGTDPSRDRRRGAYLLAASYGPVYGMLQRNGESLYVFDAINTRDYAYHLTPGSPATPVRLTGNERMANQRLIREQIDQIAAIFHFDAQPFP